jgi:hypothetical protein
MKDGGSGGCFCRRQIRNLITNIRLISVHNMGARRPDILYFLPCHIHEQICLAKCERKIAEGEILATELEQTKKFEVMNAT